MFRGWVARGELTFHACVSKPSAFNGHQRSTSVRTDNWMHTVDGCTSSHFEKEKRGDEMKGSKQRQRCRLHHIGLISGSGGIDEVVWWDGSAGKRKRGDGPTSVGSGPTRAVQSYSARFVYRY